MFAGALALTGGGFVLFGGWSGARLFAPDGEPRSGVAAATRGRLGSGDGYLGLGGWGGGGFGYGQGWLPVMPHAPTRAGSGRPACRASDR